MKTSSKAFFANAGDEEGVLYQATVVEHENAHWLVATWLAPKGPGERIPEWLLPLAAVGYHGPVSAESLNLGHEVAKELLGPHYELSAIQRAGAVLNPLLVQSQAPVHKH